MIDLKQKELAVWEERNFGRHDDDILKVALGMAEEVGEVCHHVLKGTQKIRGGVDGLNKAEIADGVADTLIYGLQLLSRLGMDAEKEISAVIDKVLQRDWKKNPEGDKTNIQQSSVDLYGEDIRNKIRDLKIPLAPMDEYPNKTLSRLVKELSDEKDSLIKEAITSIISEGWKPEDIGHRGIFAVFPGGMEVFSFDGKALLEFHGISNSFNYAENKISAELLYKKLY